MPGHMFDMMRWRYFSSGALFRRCLDPLDLEFLGCWKVSITVKKHLDSLLWQEQGGETTCKDKFDFLNEGGNQRLKVESGFQGQSLYVCLTKRKLRKIEHRSMCCLVVKRRRSNKWFLEGVEVRVTPRQDPENLRWDPRLVPFLSCGLARPKRCSITLSYHNVSWVLNTLSRMIIFTRVSTSLIPRGWTTFRLYSFHPYLFKATIRIYHLACWSCLKEIMMIPYVYAFHPLNQINA